MKPVMVQIAEGDVNACPFAIRSTNLPFFSTEFHYHKACQLVFVLESEGKRFIGDSVERFQSGEIIFLGSNVPHVWYNDPHYFERHGRSQARSVTLYFNPVVLLESMSRFINVAPLQAVLKAAQRGMKFHGETRKELGHILMQMTQSNELQRFAMLLKILELICATKEFCYLTGVGYINNYQVNETSRIDRVFNYIYNHFKEDIPLSDIAGIANMSVQAFCRFFKRRTQKSFTHFVNEVRVRHACKLLLCPEESITAVAHKCGFNTVSNFNRFFKEIKGMTPRDFKRGLIV